MISDPVLPTSPLRMTEREFETWLEEDVRAEFVDGEVIPMSPVSVEHDDVLLLLIALLKQYLQYRPVGTIRGSDFQARLREGLRRNPDLQFISSDHRDRVKRTYIDGAPDAAWEIVSDDSQERDWREKYFEYRTAGVREYWIIEPLHQTVTLYRLRDGEYQRAAAEDGRLCSEVIPGFWLRPEWLWQSPEPNINDCLREMGITP